MNRILLFKEDLSRYSTQSLHKMQLYLGLPNGDRKSLIWEIAIALSEQKAQMPRNDRTIAELERWGNDFGVSDKISDLLRGSDILLAQGRGITYIPPEISILTQLGLLNLNQNLIKRVPPEIGELTKLDFLSLSNNEISAIPSTIGNLVNLEQLDLSYNDIVSLPNSIGNLEKLEYLHLNYNRLKELPDTVGNLKKLRYLNVSGNDLRVLPISLGSLENLLYLDAEENPLESGTPQTLEQLQEKWSNRFVSTEPTPTPEEEQDCENPIDFITQEEWDTENPPTAKITFWDDNGPRRTICYSKESLLQWMEMPEHTLSVWIPNELGEQLESEGYGGGPSSNNFVVSLPDRGYILKDSANLPMFFMLLRQELPVHWLAIPISKNLRLGNQQGRFGVSNLHGQLPGETVYVLLPMSTESDLIRSLKSLISYWISKRERVSGGCLHRFYDLETIPELISGAQEIWAKYPYTDADYLCKRVTS